MGYEKERWINKGKKDAYIQVDQDLKVEELEEIKVRDDWKAKGPPEVTHVVGTNLHSAFRSLLGKSTGYKTGHGLMHAIASQDVHQIQQVLPELIFMN